MRRVLSTLLYLIVGLPVTLSTLLLLSVRPWALDREVYKRIVTDDRLYTALAAPEIAKQAPELLRAADAVFGGKALVGALQKNIPVAEIKALGAESVDWSLDLVEGKTPRTSAAGRPELDMKPLKKALRARSGAVARDYVAGLPSRPGSAAPGDFSFRPSALALPAAEADAARALNKVIDLIPDGSGELGIGAATERGSLTQSVLDKNALVMSAVSALLVGGLATLGGAGIGNRLSRAGRFLLIPSILVLGVGALMAIPGGLILGNMMPAEIRLLLGGEAGAQFRAYLASVLGGIARSFFVTGLVGTSLGGLLVSAKRIAEPKEI